MPSTRSAVTDAVEPREIGRGLGGGDDVISGHRVIRVRQGNFHDLRAEFLKLFHGGVHGGFHFRVKTADHVFLRQTEFQAFDVAVKRGGVIRHRLRHAGGIARIMPLMTPSNVAASRTSLVNGPI